ncbi:MAG: PEP-CTERM sorting domain-containing protein [Candidatus Aureabacteria bacterium]|nr:PEP-CTERM sorting domain-containing protein [Candidatus Auribacterota bacterium]
MKYFLMCVFLCVSSAIASADLFWWGEDEDSPIGEINWSYGFSDGGDTVELAGTSAPSVTSGAHSGTYAARFNWTHTYSSDWTTRAAIQIASDGNGKDSIGSSMVTHDVSAYEYLSFWVKGVQGGELFKICLNSGGYDTGIGEQQTDDLLITDYLAGVTTGWQQVVVPIADFTLDYQYDGHPGSLDLTALTGVRFKVESDLPSANSTVLLDDIYFTSVPEPSTVILLGAGILGLVFSARRGKRE